MENKKFYLMRSGIFVFFGLLMLTACSTSSPLYGRAPLTQEQTEQIIQAIGKNRINCRAAAEAADRISESTDEEAKKYATLAIRFGDECLRHATANLQFVGYLAKSRGLEETGQLAEALAVYKEGLQAFPSKQKEFWNQITLISLLRANGQYEEALTVSNQMFSENKTGMPVYYHMGRTLYKMGRYQEAVDTITAGLRFQPDYFAAYWYRGLAYERMGDKAAAKADFEHSMSYLTEKPKSEKLWNTYRQKYLKYGIQPRW